MPINACCCGRNPCADGCCQFVGVVAPGREGAVTNNSDGTFAAGYNIIGPTATVELLCSAFTRNGDGSWTGVLDVFSGGSAPSATMTSVVTDSGCPPLGGPIWNTTNNYDDVYNGGIPTGSATIQEMISAAVCANGTASRPATTSLMLMLALIGTGSTLTPTHLSENFQGPQSHTASNYTVWDGTLGYNGGYWISNPGSGFTVSIKQKDGTWGDFVIYIHDGDPDIQMEIIVGPEDSDDVARIANAMVWNLPQPGHMESPGYSWNNEYGVTENGGFTMGPFRVVLGAAP